ncbi:MAG: endolytic transglycosylase MltG [Gemmatimonadota bacterium]
MRLLTTVLVLTLVCAGCGRKPTGPKLPVQVPPGATFAEITDSLHARGLIGFKPAFRLYARLTGADARVRPGTYGFQRGESWPAILDDFREGRFLTAKLVIPEARSTPDIAARIAAITDVDSATILARLLSDSAPAKYGVPGPTLEGYLYPATYEFPLNVSPDTVIARAIAAYKRIWTPALQARADSIDMDEREVITLAAIVEKEAKKRDEMPLIASVYHNRLKIGMPLQADPTVQYASGTHRERLLYSHIREVQKNPYNTYEIRGLPPGPIGSPSAMGIAAVLYPATTKYLYFVARADGTHIFTASLDEHNRAKQQVRLGRARGP